MKRIQSFIEIVGDSLSNLDQDEILLLVEELSHVRDLGGRLFIVGNGGGAAHASHAAADFRTLAGIQSYCPSDNVSNLTAITNDCGWDKSYSEWLSVSNMGTKDALLVISVGGGSEDPKVSQNIVEAVRFAKKFGCAVLGICGRDGGFTSEKADACVLIPVSDPSLTTPIVEGLQSVILHLLVSLLSIKKAKWESLEQ